MSTHPMWSHSLPERLAMLKTETTRVGYLSPKPEYGTFRYRCFNPVMALNQHSARLSASYFFYSDLETLDNLADHVDILVVSRCPYDAPLDRLYRRFRNLGKRICSTSMILSLTSIRDLGASNLGFLLEEEELNQWTAFTSNIGRALRMSDGVITTNPFLASKISEVTSLPVFVVPNTFNDAQKQASDMALANKKGELNGIHLGYFSGSPSHALDFGVVAHQLARFLEESPHSTLTIVGHLELPSEISRFGDRVSARPLWTFCRCNQYCERLASISFLSKKMHSPGQNLNSNSSKRR